ncbi:MAG: SOS response-associated peptidase [Thermoanaerobaculia bacterium]
MCGRYTQTKAESLLRKRFRFQGTELEMPPRYNLAPGQEARVVLTSESGRRLVPMRWGLVPSWAEDESIGNRLINARAETLLQKPSFRTAFQQRRCLVPADSFFEWKKEPGSKRKVPIRFVLKGEDPFAFAGLWEAWRAPDGHELRTFTVITSLPNRLVAEVHDRMPAILKEEDEEAWLDPTLTDPARLAPLLAPFPAERMEAYAVSSRVNSGQIDEPALIERVALDESGMPVEPAAEREKSRKKKGKAPDPAQRSLFDVSGE